MFSAFTFNPWHQPPIFNKDSFIKDMKNSGSAYRKQAVEMVAISQSYVRDQDKSFDPVVDKILKM